MPDLLIELLSEEIPARMQRKAAGDLRRLVTGGLVNAGLTYEGAREYWTPRRLALDIRGLTARSSDIREEKKGPRVGAPEQAVQGFLRSAGLGSIEEAQIVSDPRKGEFYVAVVEKPGRPAEAIIAGLLPAVIRDFPWPKSMRWGEASLEPGSLRWVRPLQSILCTFGPETEEPEVVAFEIDGLRSGNLTQGHRFLAPGAITARRFDDYVASLEAARVVLDADKRKEIILSDARNLAFAQGFELVEDEGLLEEVANLVEWPVVVMGSFDEEFLALPDEVTRLTIRENQKCFVLRNGANLTNRFMLVSNIVAADGGAEIARGNGKVVRARLSDAKFFWESDLQVARQAGGFERWIGNLDSVTFHASLGSQGARIERISALAADLAKFTGAEPQAAKRAARLAKADLQSAMVFEFPELQGRMGRLYAEAAGEADDVALAIEEHYSPLGPSDAVPTAPVSATVALADKFDTLAGFWAIGEKPTGSKDPYALRRAALGAIRLILENGIRLRLLTVFAQALARIGAGPAGQTDASDAVTGDLLAFFHDRLKVFLRESGARHDLIDAVVTGEADDLLLVLRKVRALQSLVESPDGANLLAGTKRAANILAAEEKKGTRIAAEVSPAIMNQEEEKALLAAVEKAEAETAAALAAEDFERAMTALAGLRAPVDAFFDRVLVNDPDESVRANRLALIGRIRRATAGVADFSRIAG